MANRFQKPPWYNIIFPFFVSVWGVWGCSSEPSPNEPDGAYLIFREALLNGDIPALWESVSQSTKTHYDDAYDDLVATSECIERLSSGDRLEARERTGISLLDQASSGEELFAIFIRLDSLIGDDTLRAGTEIDELIVDDSGERATIVTETGQLVDLVLEDDGIWRVTTLEPYARKPIRPFADNVVAVEALATENAYLRRSHDEIIRLLGGVPESELNEGTGAAVEEGVEEGQEEEDGD